MLNITPIAHIKTDFKEKFGIPRQSGRVKSALGKIVFLPEYRNPEALRRLEEFNYLWLIFDFSESHKPNWSATVRPPRLGGNKRVGVFATRSPYRPNPLGLSSVKLERIEDTSEGKVLIVSGVDLLDGTPILDIKPYIPSYDCHTDAIGGFSENFTDYKLKVEITPDLLEIIPKNKQDVLLECLADDPRPAYQSDERLYGMTFDEFNVSFTVKDMTLKVTEIKKCDN